MLRRLFKFNNSTGLILPNEYLGALGITAGKLVSLNLNEEGNQIIISVHKETLDTTDVEDSIEDQDDQTNQYDLEMNEFSF